MLQLYNGYNVIKSRRQIDTETNMVTQVIAWTGNSRPGANLCMWTKRVLLNIAKYSSLKFILLAISRDGWIGGTDIQYNIDSLRRAVKQFYPFKRPSKALSHLLNTQVWQTPFPSL